MPHQISHASGCQKEKLKYRLKPHVTHPELGLLMDQTERLGALHYEPFLNLSQPHHFLSLHHNLAVNHQIDHHLSHQTDSAASIPELSRCDYP